MRTQSGSGAARLVAAFAGLVLVASVPVALGADSASLRSDAAALRGRQATLDSRASAAALELYALETQLGRARADVQALASRRSALAGERDSIRRQQRAARNALRVSEEQLLEVVRTLYEQNAADPLAILLGAGSLEEALAGLESLTRAAGANDRAIQQTRHARLRLDRAGAKLAARESALARVVAAAEARAAQLAAASAERERYVVSLRREQGLTAARIASLETQARSAQARTLAVEAAAPAPPPASVAVTAAPVVEVTRSGGASLTVSATGYSLPGRTASGMPVGWGVVAVDPSVIPLGTRMTVPGYGEAVAADTGGAVHGNEIDLWFPSTAQALQWGRRTVTITLH